MRKGFNVHPNSISNFISSLDIVDSAYVMGISHPEEQMVPVAFVKLKEDMDLTTAEDIINNNCSLFLEETSIPYEIVFVSDFPRNIGGKIDNKKLLEISGIDYYKSKEKYLKRIINISKFEL